MRFFALIMGFIMMGLSNLPCNDCAGEQPEGVPVLAQENKCADTGHEAHEDQCSPFCHCSCCAGLSISQHAAIETAGLPQDKSRFSSFLPANTSEVSLPVWQPPQITTATADPAN